MAEYIRHANQVLRAAGISPESQSAIELLEALADCARDWADRANALGGKLDAGAATRVAAQALAGDPEVQRRLEALELDAADLLLKIQAVVERGLAEPAPLASLPTRRRRWGDDAQPRGAPAFDPSQAAEGAGSTLVWSMLSGVQVYSAEGKRLGAVQEVVLDNGGKVAGVRVSPGRDP